MGPVTSPSPSDQDRAAKFYATAEWHTDWDDLVQAAHHLGMAAHRGQLDKAGRVYFVHHVMDVVSRIPDVDEDGKVVAYLHDVLEDTDVPVERIRDRFGPDITDAVLAITHRPHEPRADYYARVKANPLALRVKLADIASNTDPSRMALLDEATRVRLTEKYRKALEHLS
jgi:(p)ppGpp synthase/HD superfamily hydrolase